MFEQFLSTIDLVIAVILEGFKIVSNGGKFFQNIADLDLSSKLTK